MTSKSNHKNPQMTRRELVTALGTASTVAAAGSLTALEASAQSAGQVDNDISVAADGNYERVPLRKEVIRVTAVQSPIQAADANNPKPVMKKNLDRMLEYIDDANGFPGPQDLVCFHEQPIQGWSPVDTGRGFESHHRGPWGGDRNSW